jgi:hypothetical protein
MYYKESIRASYALYIVCYVSAGKEKTRVLGDALKHLLPMSRLDVTHMKSSLVEPVNRFRLTETIYMKLKCFALNINIIYEV